MALSGADRIIVQLVEEAGRLRAQPVGGNPSSRLPEALETAEQAALEKRIDDLVKRKLKQQSRHKSRGVLAYVREKIKVTRDGWKIEKDRKAEEKIEKSLDDIKAEFFVPEYPLCYEEIVRLLDIEKSPVYAKALEEWTRKEVLFTNRVERKKKKVANLKNEIYQLLGFFSVFQGVLLTAVSQSNLLHCNNLWSPIILSLVASVVTIAGVIQKLMQSRGLQKTIHSEESSLKEVVDRTVNLRSGGLTDFKFAKFYEDTDKRKQSGFRFWFYFSFAIGSLFVFALVFPLSHWRILCHPGPNPYASSPPAPNPK